MHSTETFFSKLNLDWNAEPNSPRPKVSVDGSAVRLSFYLNAFLFPRLQEGQAGALFFQGCWRYRLGPTNDEGWYRGQCRFSNRAPHWGEFYEISGDLLFDRCPEDWITVGARAPEQKHFLFYLRDNQFEVDARSWTFQVLDVED